MSIPAPWPHQIEDTGTLLRAPAHLLGLQPGLGKSRIVTDAACRLWNLNLIDTVLVVCPAPLRSIWADPDPVLGEWTKWATVDADLAEYDARLKALPTSTQRLQVVVTNPEFLRQRKETDDSRAKNLKRPKYNYPKLDPLIAWCRSRRVLLVVDESWQFQSPTATQTKALYKLRQACRRVVLLNGTLGEIKDQFTQFTILDTRILDMNWWQFKARHFKMGGYFAKEIVGYQHEAEFAAKTAPYVTVRKTRDCLDLGEEPIRTQIEARLTPATWRVYRALQDEFVAALEDGAVATALQAGVRAMRLAQVVNGFVGGVIDDDGALVPDTTREVGREKLEALVRYLEERPLDKVLVFTRFRPDVERTVRVCAEQFPGHAVAPLYGGQDPAAREEAKRLLAPGGDARRAIIVANAQSGGAGLNLTAASTVLFLANDYSLKTRAQAEGRVDRPGQTARVTYVDVLATGPKGERTIDHVIVSALRRKEDLADLPVSEWKKVLTCA